MSIIIGVRKSGKTAMVADSLFEQAGLVLTPPNKRNSQKMYRLKGTLVGLVGPSVNHNIFESLLDRYPQKLKFENRRSIFESVRSLHVILRNEYFINTSTEGDESAESGQLDFLIANKMGIYEVENHREVNEFDKFWAIGSGARFALGALRVLYESTENASDIAKEAAEVACSFDPACGLPLQQLLLK